MTLIKDVDEVVDYLNSNVYLKLCYITSRPDIEGRQRKPLAYILHREILELSRQLADEISSTLRWAPGIAVT